MRRIFGRGSRACVLGGLFLLLAISSPVTADGVPNHPRGQVIRDITYCHDGGVSQKLDLLYPTVRVAFPRAVVLFVHGGTWVTGDKSDASSSVFVQTMRANGFVVASMNYRLAPRYKFPAMTRDLTCGIRFLRANAGLYDLNADHIAAMGASAGGHLVQMLGVNNGTKHFQDTGWAGYSSKVQAVVSLWGVSDLTRHDLAQGDQNKLPSIFGATSKWAAASPINYVRAGLPPFLLVHGINDADVPVAQSKRMYRALQAEKVPSTLILAAHAGHGLKPTGGTPSPSAQTIANRAVDFVKWAFKHPQS